MRVRALALVTLVCAIAAAIGTGASFAACPSDGCPGGGVGDPVQWTLDVSKPSAGSVTSTPVGITCNSGTTSCTHDFNDGTSVTLNATPPAGYDPSWSGACSGASCSVSMTTNRTATVSWVDNSDPTTTIGSVPAKMGPSNTGVSATASDTAGVEAVRFYLDNSPTAFATDSSAPYTANVPLNNLTNGTSHTVSAEAEDVNGRRDPTRSTSTSFVVDKQAGFSGVTAVPTLVNAPPVISFTKDSDMGAISCKTEKLGTGPTTTTAGCGSPYTAQDNGEGDYTVTLQGSDDVGNSASVTRSYTLDETPPSLSVTSPTSGEVKPQGFTPTYSSSDAHGPISVECKLDSGSYSPCGPLSGSQGSHALSVRATDAAGNSTVQSVGFAFAAPPAGGGSGGVGPAISDAAIAGKLVSDLKAGAKKLGKQKQKGLAKKGKYSVSVHALLAGKFGLSFTGAATKAKAARATRIATLSKTVAGPGTYKLTLKLTEAGKKLLRKGRRVKGKLTLSFTPQGRSKVSRNKALTLKRR